MEDIDKNSKQLVQVQSKGQNQGFQIHLIWTLLCYKLYSWQKTQPVLTNK